MSLHTEIKADDDSSLCRNIDRRGRLVVGLFGLLTPIWANAEVSNSETPRSPIRRPCLIPNYSGFNGNITIKQFEDALDASVSALGAARAASTSTAEQEQIIQHILALRQLKVGLSE